MDEQDNAEDIERCIRNWAWNNHMEVLNTREFFEGIDALYRKPSLSQVVDEEMPLIINEDPNFFEKYDINLPVNQETHLFNLYYERHGDQGMNSVQHSAKVWFRHLRFFLIDHPDRTELDEAVSNYKKIIEGRFFEKSP